MPLDDSDLLELIRKLQAGLGDDRQVTEWLATLNRSVPHPNVSDLIFFTIPELTAEEILAVAKSYRPIVPPRS